MLMYINLLMWNTIKEEEEDLLDNYCSRFI